MQLHRKLRLTEFGINAREAIHRTSPLAPKHSHVWNSSTYNFLLTTLKLENSSYNFLLITLSRVPTFYLQRSTCNRLDNRHYSMVFTERYSLNGIHWMVIHRIVFSAFSACWTRFTFNCLLRSGRTCSSIVCSSHRELVRRLVCETASEWDCQWMASGLPVDCQWMASDTARGWYLQWMKLCDTV